MLDYSYRQINNFSRNFCETGFLNFYRMLFKLNKYSYLIIAISFFITAAIIENSLFKKHPETQLINDFREQLQENEKELTGYLSHLASIVKSDDFEDNFHDYVSKDIKWLEKNDFGILVYKDDDLYYWSDRSISFYKNQDILLHEDGVIQMPNGYYLARELIQSDYHIYGLHLLKHSYSYENKYLKNVFSKEYDLPDEFKIIEEESEDTYPVYSITGNYLFSVQPVGNYFCTTNQLYIPGLIYFVGLLILLLYFRRWFIETDTPFFLRLFFLAIALFLTYWLHLIFQIPKVFFLLDFFSPSIFALSDWLPSLGDFFLLSMFFLFWIYNFGKDLDLDWIKKDSFLSGKNIILLFLLFSGSLYLLVHYYIRELIFNSTVSFSLNRIIDVSAQSGLAIFSVGLLLLTVLFFTVKIVDSSKNDFKPGELIVVVSGISLFLAMMQYISIGRIYIEALSLFLVAIFLALLFSKNYLQKFTLSYLIIFVSAASLYSLVVFYNTTASKQREMQRSMAISLVAERDPAADVFLVEIQNQIRTDSVIPRLLIEDEGLIDYIEQTYFSGYFRRYDVRFFVCSGSDSLFIEMEKRMAPCIDFFEDMIEAQGIKIEGTNFYFMDNMNGRISYTGWLHYPLSAESRGVSIFIELNSDLLFEGIGFPELLIDKSMAKTENYKKFDYAKYYGGELTDKHGDYNYNFYVHSYPVTDKEFEYLLWDGMEHLFYHTREDNYVIVSRELFTFVDYLISFPYLFVFYLLSVLILILIINQSIRRQSVNFDLKFKIQAVIISIVFVSLLMVAIATVWYNVKEYKENHRNDLNEKMTSISEELDLSLEDVDKIDVEMVDWLNRELIKLSNMFNTDINIYGTDGRLIASSRSEVYNRGLISPMMNTQAYYQIFDNFQISCLLPEEIGKMSYLSAYRPIINNRGDYLGAINLPYFINQDRYSQELSTIIVAFLNLYVLLFLVSIIVAIFISNQITRPLVLIQENLRKMQLGKRNEPIQYKRNDEIGSLVREYNRKVEELAVSAELLARSERESAWREMAKQIAHEIKNPLTPMKLNIQHLQRAKGKDEEYNEYLDRVSSTLIEQIDNLSNIATEFSNFAKMPMAKTQVFKLADQLRKVLDLFDTHQGNIEFHTGGLEYLEVKADREQFSRAIINLIKNGIQAIPDYRDPNIIINLSRREEYAIISVSDNGTGIPESLRNKLFSPSFTTKSGGMGLGLAIVKNIVENFSGYVWYETEQDKGSTFHIEIPIWEG